MKRFVVTTVITATLLSSTVLAGERLSLGYIYNASKSHIEIVEATRESVNVVSPTCFDLTTNGKLEINSILDEEFIQNMHEKGIKVTPFLSNHWGKKRAQAALAKPEILVDELVNAIYLYNFDGVNVDLENLSSKDKEKLTNFMKLLREALPEDKTVSIAVAPNPKRLTTTWVAAYDYEALAQYVDYFLVMTYDEHCYGGAEGPVASIGFVEESIKVILESVSKDKILLGIPMYGRYWKKGEDVGGEAIILGQIERILKKYKKVPQYGNVTQTPQITIEVKEGEKGPYVNGKYLTEGIYNIYYDNESSIKAKLALVNKYDLLGAGVWALDNESYDMWEYYKDALNETPYESTEELEIRKELELRAVMLANMPFVCPEILSYEVKNKYSIELQKVIEDKSKIKPEEIKIKEPEHILQDDLKKKLLKMKQKVVWLRKEEGCEKISNKQMDNIINLIAIIKARTMVAA